MSGKGKMSSIHRPCAGKGKFVGGKGCMRIIKTTDDGIILKKAFPVAGLRRLGRRAGTTRISEKVYEMIRKDLEDLADKIVKDTVLHVELAKRKTVKSGDMFLALKNNEIKLSGYDTK